MPRDMEDQEIVERVSYHPPSEAGVERHADLARAAQEFILARDGGRKNSTRLEIKTTETRARMHSMGRQALRRGTAQGHDPVRWCSG